MAKRIVIPFATSGDKSVTPNATDPTGAVSWSQGWGPDYQRDNTDPQYKPVGRQEMNGIFYDISDALSELQFQGLPSWVQPVGLIPPYPINAIVRHLDVAWRSTVANNSAIPGADEKWASQSVQVTIATGGTAAALTLSPTPAIDAYRAGQNFRVVFGFATTPSSTINVSGKGAVNLRQYDSTGAKVAAITAAGQISNIEFDGSDWVVLDPLPAAVPVQRRQGVRGAALNWKASADGLSPAIVYSAAMVTVCNAAGDAITLINISGNLGTSTVANATTNGMASGATVPATTYGIYVWHNPTSGATVITGDISLTAPTAPAAGFTHWARRGTFRTDPSVNKFPFAFIGAGNLTQLNPATGRNITDAFQVANVTGTIGSTLVNISMIVPSTAIAVDFTLRINAVGASVAAAVTPLVSSQNLAGGLPVPSGATANTKQRIMIAEVGAIYWGVAVTSGGTVTLYVAGWEDAL